ncbi:cobalt ABC transporter permease [Mameliella sediminis]|uniref:cobalt ABC transporter permease n=1 Tax=Mameliella sediminis TaxID=2836866 RepID=UPI001C472CCC|nr:cobalt ABC transporter permease [Mameliella sediminis]MBV7392615.1 cobalt ABC transporter permease [Mameliella sediminis]MBY6163539.1 cobalt ABC transporter permease [Mameliella alba]MBY6171802.1 cobalt ABC transporter permease [Mameliella alba]MBY6177027.1 cobalt ABC transporter permease [Mameliella alba]
MKRVVLVLTLCALPLPALAHKVIASVFPSGSAIEGEIGLSNGEMAPDLPVQVFGPDGTLLGETVTDEDGFFLFQPTQPVAHTFRADLGAGHVADVTMSAEDVARLMGKAPTPAAVPVQAVAPATGGNALSDADRAEIARIVRDEMRPLRREIAAYREKNDLQTILGGIGYILGLFGLGFYIAARRQLKSRDAA